MVQFVILLILAVAAAGCQTSQTSNLALATSYEARTSDYVCHWHGDWDAIGEGTSSGALNILIEEKDGALSGYLQMLNTFTVGDAPMPLENLTKQNGNITFKTTTKAGDPMYGVVVLTEPKQMKGKLNNGAWTSYLSLTC